jgi:hypothetical protein
MAQLERLVRSQQDVIARQQERIEYLEGHDAAVSHHADTPSASAPGAEHAALASSRATLLKLGGAAAAAGVAAAAVGVTSSGTAQAHHNLDTIFTGAGAGHFAAAGNGTTGANGLQGSSDSSFGVLGQSITSGTAVQGIAKDGNGVVGNSTNSSGLAGISTNFYGASLQDGLSPLYLKPDTSLVVGPPSTGVHQRGEIFVDFIGNLWSCIGPGSTWIKLSGPQSTVTGGAISYLSTPVRLLDALTGATSGLVNRGPLAGNEVYLFTVAGLGSSGIPANAQGLVGNITVLGPSGIGNLSLFPGGAPGPQVASMTFGQPGLFLANAVNVGIGTGGQINIQNQSDGTTPLVLDAVAFIS